MSCRPISPEVKAYLDTLWEDDMGPSDSNFCHVFELPDHIPHAFCFGGGVPVEITMVDWFNPWPDDRHSTEKVPSWEQAKASLSKFIAGKRYAKPGKEYIVITNFGEALLIKISSGDGDE